MAIPRQTATRLSFDMTTYVRVRTYVVGPSYWEPMFQQEIKRKMHPFMAEMCYDATADKVHAELELEGKDYLAESVAISPENRIPRKELHCLIQMLEALRTEAQNEPPNSLLKQIFTGLYLPEPSTAPELYRLYRYEGNTHLAIIWGLLPKNDKRGHSLQNLNARHFFSSEYVERGIGATLKVLALISAVAIITATVSYICFRAEISELIGA